MGILPSATVVASIILSTFYTPLGKQPSPLRADVPPRQTPSRADTPPGRHHAPPNTATAADGTHPTGMHSCFGFIFLFSANLERKLQKCMLDPPLVYQLKLYEIF